jgi:nucleotide-binding universal stress UspA family protein
MADTSKNVLVPIDFSDASDVVVGHAVDLAHALSARLTLLHVAPPEPEFIGYEPGPQSVRDAVARKYHEQHARLQEIEKAMANVNIETTSLLVQGYTVEKILKEAERLNATLIVMGSHGHGALHNLLVGSVTEGVLRRARCPVVIVPRALAG